MPTRDEQISAAKTIGDVKRAYVGTAEGDFFAHILSALGADDELIDTDAMQARVDRIVADTIHRAEREEAEAAAVAAEAKRQAKERRLAERAGMAAAEDARDATIAPGWFGRYADGSRRALTFADVRVIEALWDGRHAAHQHRGEPFAVGCTRCKVTT